MANKKLSQLSTATALTGPELMYVVQGGASKQTDVGTSLATFKAMSAPAVANLVTLAGVTPGATGLALLDDATADAALTTLGFGAAGKTIAAAATAGVVNDYIDNFPEVKPQKFGAVGDGITNDNAAMLLWAADTSSPNKVIPAGTYNFTSNLVFPSNCYVRGKGQGSSILKRTAAGASTAALKSSGDNVFFEDFTLDGPTVATYVNEENGIEVVGTLGDYATGGGTRRVEVKNFGSFGIKSNFRLRFVDTENYVHNVGYGAIFNLSCNFWRATNNVVDTITPGTALNAYGIVATHYSGDPVCNGFFINENAVFNVIIWEAYDTHGGQNGTFIGNYALNCKYGINVSSAVTSDVAPANIVISNNILNAGNVAVPGRGIGSGGSITSQAEGIIVTGNTVIGYGLDTVDNEGAIMFNGTNGLILSNNTLRGSLGGGICFKLVNNDALVTGNNVTGVGGASGGRAAFKVRSGTTTGFVDGNTFDGSSNAATNLAAGSTTTGLFFGRNRYVSSGTVHSVPSGVGFMDEEPGTDVVATNADFTLTPGSSKANVLHTGTLTASRTVTFAAPSANILAAKFRITRTGTGLFQLVLGTTGHALGTGEWAEVRHDGTNYYVAERGFVSTPVDVISTDAAVTITPHANSSIIRHTGTLTADRAVTLATTSAIEGDRFRITRNGAGAFNLNVGTGPLKALATSTWCEVIYNGSAWYLSAYGAL